MNRASLRVYSRLSKLEQSHLNTSKAGVCNLFFDSKPQRGENLLDGSFHNLFRRLQPQARLLLPLTQAHRGRKGPVCGGVAGRLPGGADRGGCTDGGDLSGGPQQCRCCATKHGPRRERRMMKSPDLRERSFRSPAGTFASNRRGVDRVGRFVTGGGEWNK